MLLTVEIFERLLPAYWWTDPTEAIGGPVWIAFAVLLAAAFVAGVAVWLLAPRLAPEHRLHRRLMLRAARWTVGLSAVGLLLLLFRWQVTPFLSKRLWLMLWMVCVVGVGAYAERYRRTTYRQDLADMADEERLRRYLPRRRGGGSRSRRQRRHGR